MFDSDFIDLSRNKSILDLELYDFNDVLLKQALLYPSSMKTLKIFYLKDENIPFCLSNLPMNLDMFCLKLEEYDYYNDYDYDNYVKLASYLTNKNLKCLDLWWYCNIEFTLIYDLLSDKCQSLILNPIYLDETTDILKLSQFLK